jgi:shikimate dehydrogenase
MKNYRIIGHPLTFCLTTPVMNGAFKALGVDAHFETVDIEPDQLSEVMEALREGKWDGLIATMPYKTPSLAFLDEASEDVQAINAVNLIVRKDGKLHGYNTDWMGAVGALKSGSNASKESNGAGAFTDANPVAGKQALILGAGGAARAAAYGLKKEGAKVTVWNRSPHKAKEFAEAMGLEWVEELGAWNTMPNLIVNATASSDQARQSTIVPYRLWKDVQLALDAVYGKTSLFLEEAKAAQVPQVLSGEIWFLNQVFPLFKILTGIDAPEELMSALTHESKEIVA